MEVIIKLNGLGVGIPRTCFGIKAISASEGISQEALNRKNIRMNGGQLASTRARGRARLVSQ